MSSAQLCGGLDRHQIWATVLRIFHKTSKIWGMTYCPGCNRWEIYVISGMDLCVVRLAEDHSNASPTFAELNGGDVNFITSKAGVAEQTSLTRIEYELCCGQHNSLITPHKQNDKFPFYKKKWKMANIY